MTDTLTAQQVAAALQASTDWFYRARAALEAEGFPRPLPLPSVRGNKGRAPMRWSADAVSDWIRNPRKPHIVANENAPPAPAGRRADRERLRGLLG